MRVARATPQGKERCRTITGSYRKEACDIIPERVRDVTDKELDTGAMTKMEENDSCATARNVKHVAEYEYDLGLRRVTLADEAK